MNKWQRRSLASLLTVLLLLVTACGTKTAQPPSSGTAPAAYLTIKDDAGREVILKKKPERLLVLSPSLFDMLYAIGGKTVGRISSRTVPADAAIAALPQVGFVYNIEMEKLVSLQPDLVIAEQGRHEKLVPLLESAGIPVLLLRMKTYDDVFAKVKLLGDIAGTPDTANRLVQDMSGRVNNLIAKLPAAETKVVILHATAKSVTVELENSVTGSIAKLLRLKNIAAGSKPLEGDPDTTPYSLETVVANDPDIILIVTMGTAPEIEARMRADVESNPAWATMRAVREKKILFLPSELFLVNPGLKISEAVEYLARSVYPTVYTNGQ